MNILLTGDKGFVGSHLKQAFKSESIGGWDWKDGLEIANIDTAHGDYDLVINCAGESFNKDRMIWTNVYGLEKVALFCKERKLKLIHFSSVTVFGKGLYGLSKRMGEDLIKEVNPPGFVILRMSNVYGKGSMSPANRFENGESEIFGDGYAIKDHFHVKDLITAVKMAIKDDYWAGTVNLSSGVPATIRDTFKIFGKGKPKFVDKKSDIQVSVLDNSRALSLGWKPTWNIYDH